MSEAFQRGVFLGCATFLVGTIAFAGGLVVERYRIWPYSPIHEAWRAAGSLLTYSEFVPEGRRVRAPDGASRSRFVVHDSAEVDRGYYIFVGWNNEEMLYTAWLYDETGDHLHTWPIDYQSIDPDGPLNGADNPHAFLVENDGSIIVGFDKGDVMSRLDSCGTPMWIKEGVYHHSLSRAGDGSFWVWRGSATAYGHYNYAENFSGSSGEPLRELSFTADIIKHAPANVFGVRSDFAFEEFERDPDPSQDLFHPNDVEALSSELAAAFPMFAVGDLLMSFRNLNLVTVVDPITGRLKWWSHGPWIYQHDPDFTADGQISVYSNNTGRGRSEILKMDPATRTVTNELSDGDLSFYSAYMGKHQYLPNGNVLIVVPGEGRVLEATETGQVVMEFNNLSSSSTDYNEHVQNGVWVPDSYFHSVPSCSTRAH